MTSLTLLAAVLFQFTVISRCLTSNNGEDVFSESLTPYIIQHGSHMNHREIRDCHKTEYGSPPHELYQAQQPTNTSVSFVKVRHFVKQIGQTPKRNIKGHYVAILDPLKTLSVLEPDQAGGCNLSILQTVPITAKKGNCIVAVNAGFFDTRRGTCYGNVISDGRKARNSQGIQNAHFGITKDGQIFIGYLSEEEYNSGNFQQLVGGVVWVLRNGTGFVNASKGQECEDSQETGTMDKFVNILSARTIVGHDKDGNVLIVQVDGKTGSDGMSLNEVEELLKGFGLINAVNLDGGGSATLTVDGVTANYPSDSCPDGKFSCERKVSTILCVHAPYCEPKNCNNHGTCSMGECVCEKNWQPPSCAELFCGQTNCSNHGICLSEGCICHPGYYGENCDKVCKQGWFGSMCLQQCECLNADSCDSISGICKCKPGFTGKKCERECSQGYFGVDCQSKCLCKDDCFCDRITGSCEVPQNSSLYYAAKCLANSLIEEQHLVKENKEEKRKWYATVIILGVITSLCLTSLLLVLFCSCSCRCRNEQVLCCRNNRRKFTKVPLQLPSGELSDSMSDNEIFPMKSMQTS